MPAAGLEPETFGLQVKCVNHSATADRGGSKATQTVIERNPCKQSRKSKAVSLRVGTVNIGSMSRRSGEVVDMAGRRDLDFCCLQETRWKGVVREYLVETEHATSFSGVDVRRWWQVWEFWWLRDG